MPGRTSPTLLRRQLGALLRQYREARNETASDVAKATNINASVISRLENGGRRPGLIYVRELSRHYGLDQDTTDQLMRVARASHQNGWWEAYDVNEDPSTYVEFEAGAAAIKNFELAYVPGLLQTRDYARSVIVDLNPSFTEDKVDQAVSLRIERQHILDSADPVRLHAIIDESVVRRNIGGAAVMKAQLNLLVERATLPNVTLQVLPFSTPRGFGLFGSFSLLSFADAASTALLSFDGSAADVAYAEGPLGAIVQPKVREVQRCKDLFSGLTAIAASESKSITIIQRVLSEVQFQ
ncbi:helix-turn-helix domain-containing protein [Couchioplanes caeruleus]|uniref:helix-turn-helix domain-containing protein n=1 Tax=Couchioplanes caeruleus TaxID=56438 RepID=UPI0020BFF07F|nr:helix-turn-helix transcriptional regulator [Couchioplanes caeruleus]UQU64196.1 helix-turn-helix domain-containing protein [Couchioplanes caeruleus]